MGWKEFEQECYKYLCQQYAHKYTRFKKLGEEDSTKPDIFVSLSAEEKYYIEVKEPLAQCGQFVLLPNDTINKFEYSPRNKSPLDTNSSGIISYMNSFYSEYRNVGTRGKIIDLNTDIFVNWIINYYGNKGVKFFITKGNSGYVILPVEKIGIYFDVTAKYREKKSGSANPSQNNIEAIKKVLSNSSVNDYLIKFERSKLYVSTQCKINNLKGKIGDYIYLFKMNPKNDYIVKRLSNTSNSNVIFSIKLKKEQDILDLKLFEDSLSL